MKGFGGDLVPVGPLPLNLALTFSVQISPTTNIRQRTSFKRIASFVAQCSVYYQSTTILALSCARLRSFVKSVLNLTELCVLSQETLLVL